MLDVPEQQDLVTRDSVSPDGIVASTLSLTTEVVVEESECGFLRDVWACLRASLSCEHSRPFFSADLMQHAASSVNLTKMLRLQVASS